MLMLLLVAAAFGAKLAVSPNVRAKLEPTELSRRAAGKLYVYRVDARPRSEARLNAFADVVGIPGEARNGNPGWRYADDVANERSGASYDERKGFYRCYREGPSELTVQSSFPSDLNDRATALLGELALDGEEYVLAGMNAFVLQEPGGVAAREYRRTYSFKRMLDGGAVLASEGSATVQFDRRGRLTLLEIPAVTFTRQSVPEPLEPTALPERLEAFAGGCDTMHIGERAVDIDSVAVCAVACSYRKETRNGRSYLVPSQSVLIDCFPRGGEPVRRECHFTLDRASRHHVHVDPWLKSK